MSHFDRPAVTAVLGPTNTGKTHLAVERLCAHSSGVMGFPLRLLARARLIFYPSLHGLGELPTLGHHHARSPINFLAQ